MSDKQINIVISGGEVEIGDIVQGTKESIGEAPSVTPTQTGHEYPSNSPNTRSTMEPIRTTGQHTHHVFVCFNSLERDQVRKLTKHLTRSGIRVWLDELEIAPGTLWQDLLTDALANTTCALILIGREGVGPWQKAEIQLLLSRSLLSQCRVIPVLLPNTQLDKVPLFLRQYQYVDLRHDYELAVQKLAQVISQSGTDNEV